MQCIKFRQALIFLEYVPRFEITSKDISIRADQPNFSPNSDLQKDADNRVKNLKKPINRKDICCVHSLDKSLLNNTKHKFYLLFVKVFPRVTITIENHYKLLVLRYLICN